jgi:hypothetical protein
MNGGAWVGCRSLGAIDYASFGSSVVNLRHLVADQSSEETATGS